METVEKRVDENAEQSPNYLETEVTTLLDLIEKYKHVILPKCGNTGLNRAKIKTWIKIGKEFNQLSTIHHRSASNLRTKWFNLKKQCSNIVKNLNDTKSIDGHLKRVVALSYEADNINYDETTFEAEEELEDEAVHEKRVHRSMNFNPLECKLLLNLVKEEKKYLFSKRVPRVSEKLKRNAWWRITEKFNKNNDPKRTTRTLINKFKNMRNMARSLKNKDFIKDIGKRKYHTLKKDVVVKQERFQDDDEDDMGSVDNDVFNCGDVRPTSEAAPDPLFTVLNGDGLYGFSNSDSARSSQHKSPALNNDRDVKEKILELVNYKMETAKLDRQRLLDSIKAEASLRESRDLEQAMRLRAARLKVISAESQLPHNHPGLKYTRDEEQTEFYLKTGL